MRFDTICLLATISTGLFGLAFLLAPEATAQLYGISGWNPGTLAMTRFFGVGLLGSTAANAAVRGATDPALRRRFAAYSSAATAAGTGLALHTVLTGAASALTWSTVLIYGFFCVAWAMLAARERP